MTINVVANIMSTTNLLAGEFASGHIRTEFCMRTAFLPGVRWPAGSYCILKKWECPKGNFTSVLFHKCLTVSICSIKIGIVISDLKLGFALDVSWNKLYICMSYFVSL